MKLPKRLEFLKSQTFRCCFTFSLFIIFLIFVSWIICGRKSTHEEPASYKSNEEDYQYYEDEYDQPINLQKDVNFTTESSTTSSTATYSTTIQQSTIAPYETWSKCLDLTADPCKDFYAFTCGNYEDSYYSDYYEIPSKIMYGNSDAIKTCLSSSLFKKSNTSEAVRKMQMYGQTYNAVKFSPYALSAPEILKEIDAFGSCPILDNNWSASKFSTTNSFLKITNMIGKMFYFYFYTYRDLDDGSTNLVLKVGNETMVRNDYMFPKYGEYDYYYFDSKDYKLSLLKKQAFTRLAYLIQKSNIKRTDKELSQVTSDVLDVEMKIWEAMNEFNAYQKWQKEFDENGYFLRHNDSHLSKIRFKELKKLLPFLELRYFLDNAVILPEVRKRLTQNPYIYVERLGLTKRLSSIFSRLSRKEMANLLCVKYMSLKTGYLDLDEINGYGKPYANKMDMVSVFTKSFPLISDYLFVEHCIDSTVFKTVKGMIVQVRLGAEKMIQENKWLDASSKNWALLKLRSMKNVVGALEVSLNASLLDNYYEDLKFSSTDNLREMNRKVSMFFRQKELLEFLRPEKDVSRYIKRANTINAYNQRELNMNFIHAAYLIVPNFDLSVPIAVNYGALGTTLGHELFHSFDTSGVRYDFNGARKSWLSHNSSTKFKQQIECLEEQYSKVENKLSQRQFNSINEDVADNGGVRAAFYAYKATFNDGKSMAGYEKFNSDQLFFIAHGVTECSSYSYKMYVTKNAHHSNPEHRVNEVLKNMPEFAKAFNCSVNSPMNPVNKCRVW